MKITANSGECRLIGCDGKLGGARLDRCGVCRGDGSSCKEKEHVWNDHKPYYGKVSIKTIPVGSTNIKGLDLKKIYWLIIIFCS